jgi:hypothetical protein
MIKAWLLCATSRVIMGRNGRWPNMNLGAVMLALYLQPSGCQHSSDDAG